MLRFLGFAEFNNRPAFISDWMVNGTLIEFLVKNDNADRLNMACDFVTVDWK